MEILTTTTREGVRIVIVENDEKFYFAEQYIGKKLIGYEIGQLTVRKGFQSEEPPKLGVASNSAFGGSTKIDQCFNIYQKEIALQKYKAASGAN